MLARVLVGLLTYLSRLCQGLQCHSCYVKPPPRAPGTPEPEHQLLCSTFDGSDK